MRTLIVIQLLLFQIFFPTISNAQSSFKRHTVSVDVGNLALGSLQMSYEFKIEPSFSFRASKKIPIEKGAFKSTTFELRAYFGHRKNTNFYFCLNGSQHFDLIRENEDISSGSALMGIQITSFIIVDAAVGITKYEELDFGFLGKISLLPTARVNIGYSF